MTFERLRNRMAEPRGDDLFVPRNQSLDISPSTGEAQYPPFWTSWPAFPADLMGICPGRSHPSKRRRALSSEDVREPSLLCRQTHPDGGARIVVCDPHRALVYGPSALMGDTMTGPDIRAGMAISTRSRRSQPRGLPGFATSIRSIEGMSRSRQSWLLSVHGSAVETAATCKWPVA